MSASPRSSAATCTSSRRASRCVPMRCGRRRSTSPPSPSGSRKRLSHASARRPSRRRRSMCSPSRKSRRRRCALSWRRRASSCSWRPARSTRPRAASRRRASPSRARASSRSPTAPTPTRPRTSSSDRASWIRRGSRLERGRRHSRRWREARCGARAPGAACLCGLVRSESAGCHRCRGARVLLGRGSVQTVESRTRCVSARPPTGDWAQDGARQHGRGDGSTM
mmetsp:Transcript_66714/g.177564  ORF Transcript_66714/g.177564 Transcript_66714/m.177564 type:complete len:224 (-) Transcript_66714:10-681(-)